MRLAMLVAILVAGCSAAPAPEGPEAPIASRDDAPEDDPAAGLRLSECIGMSVHFYFDAEAAKSAVPPPFEPVISVGEEVGAFGILEHRACQAHLNGTDLGAVALAIGSALVRAPAQWSNGSYHHYVMRLATDHPELAAHLEGHGLPAETVDPADASLWAAPGAGIMDSTIGGDRIIGVVADSDMVSSGVAAPELFYHGDNITRWTYERNANGGDIAESVLMLDETVWGWRTSPNLYFSTFVVDSLQDHEFVHFTP